VAEVDGRQVGGDGGDEKHGRRRECASTSGRTSACARRQAADRARRVQKQPGPGSAISRAGHWRIPGVAPRAVRAAPPPRRAEPEGRQHNGSPRGRRGTGSMSAPRRVEKAQTLPRGIEHERRASEAPTERPRISGGPWRRFVRGRAALPNRGRTSRARGRAACAARRFPTPVGPTMTTMIPAAPRTSCLRRCPRAHDSASTSQRTRALPVTAAPATSSGLETVVSQPG